MGVPFEFAVVLGVLVLGVGVVLVVVLVWDVVVLVVVLVLGVFGEFLDACIMMCMTSVSRNAGDFTDTDKPACVRRWRRWGSWYLV